MPSPRRLRSRRQLRSHRRRLPDTGTDAHDLALRALGRKERTEAELSRWLAERGVEEAERAEVLAQLVEEGALDDERFARRYAEDKRELAGWGPDRIREALGARGVAEELIDLALEAETPDGVVERAVAVLQRSGAEVADEASRRRALSLLARRGYPLETAYDAIRALERNG